MDARSWRRRIEVLRREAGAGDVRAIAELGELLQLGAVGRRNRFVVRPNPREGFRLLLRAASKGEASGAFPLAYAYDVGLGTRKDRRQALRWYRRAARTGNSAACTNIAVIHRDARNLRAAFEWWRRGAEMGDGDAAVDAGYCCQYGIGTRRSTRRARRLYEAALGSKLISAAGREEAMYHLAVALLDDGETGAASRLLARAAADGDFPEAMSLLEQVRTKRRLVPCRCRRGLRKSLPGHAACPRHPRHVAS